MPGAMNSCLLQDVLIETIATFSNAEKDWCQSRINPLNSFKLGTLERLDIENKEIIIAVQNSPVAICGDDISYIKKTSRLLSELHGFQ